MKKNIIYILSLLILIFSSCREEILNQNSGEDIDYAQILEQGYDFSINIEDFSKRTRDVNFQPGASLRLNTVWIGIFDQETGHCISNNFRLMNYVNVTSGVKQSGIVRVKLAEPRNQAGVRTDEYDNKDLIAVCIANISDVEYSYQDDTLNYDDNSAEDGENLDPHSLRYKLTSIKTWKEFIEIAVDAKTGFEGAHNSDAPVLAGFLYDDSKADLSHIKVNQYIEDDGVHLSPGELVSSVTVKYGSIKSGSDKVYYSEQKTGQDELEKVLLNKAMTLHLRRLVANINVNISIENNSLELTDVQVRRFNLPHYAYIIERRTTNCEIELQNGKLVATSPGTFAEEANLSPNYSDKFPKDEVKGYYSDDNFWDPQNPTSFSFQHFANKHWSRLKKNTEDNLVDSQGKVVEREEKNNDGQFKALAGEKTREGYKTDDFNNYASYFVLKLHLVDKTSGKAYDALYTIHEGNTSDEMGNEIPYTSVPIGNKLDYVSARNMNYYYNVVVRGVKNIYYNVTTSDHANGQAGNIWEMKYVTVYDENHKLLNSYYDNKTGSYVNPISKDGGIFEDAITINNTNPEIAFRLYGRVSQNEPIEGFNYNLPTSSFESLKGLWPPAAEYSNYYLGYNELYDPENSNKKDIPANLLDGLRIIDYNGEHKWYTSDEFKSMTKEEQNNKILNEAWNVKRFVGEHYVDESDPNHRDKTFENVKYHLWIAPTELTKVKYTEKNDYVRAIYIADRKGQQDRDGCTTLINIFVAAQYPEILPLSEDEKIKLELKGVEENSVNLEKYRVIDQFLPSFNVNTLRTIEPAFYDYNLIINGIPIDDYGVRYDNYYTYSNIPVSLFSVDNNKITVQAKTNSEFFTDSDILTLGTLKLSNHKIWNAADGEDFATALSKAPSAAGVFKYEGNYLTFRNDNSSSNGISKNGNNIKFNTNTAYIILKVYSPCIITMTGQNNAVTEAKRLGINMTLYGSDGKIIGQDPFDTQYFNTSQTLNLKVEQGSFTGQKYVEVYLWRASATGTDVTSIEVKPLN